MTRYALKACIGALALPMAFFAGLVASGAAPSPLEAAVSSSPQILSRRQKDHHIELHQETLGDRQAIHVFLTEPNYQAPYSFSLGWFSDGENGIVDELGQKIPLPGDRPEGKHFPRVEEKLVTGFDLVSEGKLKKAISQFEAAIKQSPENARAHNNLGAALAADGQLGRAETELNQALKLKADYALARANKATLALVLDQPKLSLSDAEKALKLHKNFKHAVVVVGLAYLKLGLTDQAVKVGDAAFVRWPSDPQVCVLAGDANLAKGLIKEAQKRYQKAALFDPHNPRILLRIADTASRLGDLDEALRRARKATHLAPKNPEAHLALGRYLESDRKYRAAQLQYERVLELKPEKSLKLKVSGPYLRLLVSMNRTEEADKLSAAWVEEYPENANCHYNRAWLLSQLPGTESKDRAVAEYRKSLALDPRLSQAHYNLALLLVNQGKADRAEAELRSFIQKSPDDPDLKSARDLLGRISKAKGSAQEK